MNILIVDDDRFMRGMLFQMVNNIAKHEVSFVTNGHSAVSLLVDPVHGFDLVFIDLRMPRLNGDKVIEIIQDMMTNVHFVVLTGRPSDFPNLPKHIQIVQKPFDYSVIEQIIRGKESSLKGRCKTPAVQNRQSRGLNQIPNPQPVS